jgi:replicative DNA helicase
VTSINPFEEEKGIPLEYKLFALCFNEPGAVEFFSSNLDPNIVGIIHGETGIHEFYKTIVDFYHSTKLDPIDPIAFRSWLEDTEIFSALGGESGVRTFMQMIMEAELPDKHQTLKVLQIRANRRKQLSSLHELQLILNKKEIKKDEDIARISQLTDDIRDLENQLDLNPLDFVTTGIQMIDNIESLLDIPSFIPTQFKSLNKSMGYSDDGGFYRGVVHTILAASGLGKSTFCKSLCNHWLDTGYKVLFINFEEAQNHWERILFTQVIKDNVYKNAESWDDFQREKYTTLYRAKLAEWGDRLMVRHDPDTPYFDDLELWFRDVIGHNEKLPDIVVIDTIQSLFTKGAGKPRWAEYEQMMVRLEKLAKDMDTVMILTAQENTNRMKEKREVVMQSDTGGSIAIQQKSSVTMFLTPISNEGDDNVDTTLMQLQMPKNRITGGAFSMDPPIIRYDDNSKSYIPYELPTSYGKEREHNKDLLSTGIEQL